MVVQHSGRNQNACKHSAAGTATAERSIWGQVLGTDLSRHVPMTCLLIRRVSLPPPAMKISSVPERGSRSTLHNGSTDSASPASDARARVTPSLAREEVDRVRPSSSRARPLAPLG
jgi:hypothetical protein